MARNYVITTKPTMPPERAIGLLQRLIDQAEALEQEEPYADARDLWKQNAHGALIAALGQPHQILQDFDGFAEISSAYDTPRAKLENENRYLGYRLNALKAAVEQLGWQLPETQRQNFFTAGSQHDAFVEIRKVITQVRTAVLIVDSYVDGTLWALLKNTPSIASIRILTARPTPDFAVEAKAFVNQHGNRVEARKTKDFHDRFIFVDAGGCWHLGASIKDAGKQAFLFSEIVDPKNVAVIRQNAEDTWNAATLLL
jgi:hypothetical protein